MAKKSAIVMGVSVDKTRCNVSTLAVNFKLCPAGRAYSFNSAVLYLQVCSKCLTACAVKYLDVSDADICHAVLSFIEIIIERVVEISIEPIVDLSSAKTSGINQ